MDMIFNILHRLQPYAVAIVFLLGYAGEHLLPERKLSHELHHNMMNIGIGLLNMVFVLVAGYGFQRYITWTNQIPIGLLRWIQLPLAAELLLSFILIDLFMYGWHRLNHSWKFLWRFHRFHHTDTALNSTSAVRFHTGELFFSFIARMLVFPLLGVSVTAIVGYGLILFPVIVFHHANVRISTTWDHRIRRFIVSPRMHRIHHSDVPRETDSNFSSILPYWDRFFGTYIHETNHPIRFGL